MWSRGERLVVVRVASVLRDLRLVGVRVPVFRLGGRRWWWWGCFVLLGRLGFDSMRETALLEKKKAKRVYAMHYILVIRFYSFSRMKSLRSTVLDMVPVMQQGSAPNSNTAALEAWERKPPAFCASRTSRIDHVPHSVSIFSDHVTAVASEAVLQVVELCVELPESSLDKSDGIQRAIRLNLKVKAIGLAIPVAVVLDRHQILVSLRVENSRGGSSPCTTSVCTRGNNT